MHDSGIVQEILGHLAVSGPTGAIAVLFILLFLRQQQKTETLQKEHAGELAVLHRTHADELAAKEKECKTEITEEKDARINDSKNFLQLTVSMHDKAHQDVQALLEVTRAVTGRSFRSPVT